MLEEVKIMRFQFSPNDDQCPSLSSIQDDTDAVKKAFGCILLPAQFAIVVLEQIPEPESIKVSC